MDWLIIEKNEAAIWKKTYTKEDESFFRNVKVDYPKNTKDRYQYSIIIIILFYWV